MTLGPVMPRDRYVVLDSLRGVCACMVVLYHFRTQGGIAQLPVIQHGFLFVDFFFVLSGFVIGSSYGDRIRSGFPVGRFMWLRLGRIYPLHIVMLFVFLAFEIVFAVFMPGLADRRPFEGTNSPQSFFQSLALVQIFFGGDGVYWNMPSWSIAAEVWTYLVFALLLRYAWRWLIPICIAIIVVVPIFLAFNTDRYLNVGHDGAFARCLFGFSLGVVGWRVAFSIQALRVPPLADHIVEVALIMAVIALVAAAGAGPLSLAAPFLFFVVVLIFSRERGLVSALLKRHVFVSIGVLSYSIYMIHAFLYYRFLNGLGLLQRLTGHDLLVSNGGHNSVGGGALFGDAMTIVFLALVIFCSYWSYQFIERPGRDFSRRLVQKREAELLPAPVGAP